SSNAALRSRSNPRKPTAGLRRGWPACLKRVYDIDALACACGGRLHFIALIVDEEPARSILASLKLPTQTPPLARRPIA
ncbi:MAG: hypothetical protein ABIQ16_14115, partial [Polyangiaceae bacterium]